MITVHATAHDGLSVCQNGNQMTLAVLDANGKVLASGEALVSAIEQAAQAAYHNYIKARGHGRVEAQA